MVVRGSSATGGEAGAAPREGVLIGALAVGFFASGFAALLYQIVWQRMLGMFAGSDSVTAAIVVGAFLLGLGIGSMLASAVVDRLTPRQAAAAFILCEVAVALFALASRPFLYDFVVEELGPTLSGRWEAFAICFAGLLAPTLMMGLSLPLLAKAVVSRIETAANRIGLLYGLNTVGAGLGALVGGYLIVGSLGFERAIWVGAALNVLAAALAAAVMGHVPRLPAPSRAVLRAASAEPLPAAAGGIGLAGWTFLVFVSGYFIVALEILWVRVLGLMAQTNAYSFSLILGVFLLADGLGVVAGSRWVGRLSDVRRAFFLVQGWGALYALVTLGALWLCYDWPAFAEIMAIDRWRIEWPASGTTLAAVLILVGPPAFLLGLSFPLVQKAVQQDLAVIGFRVGVVQLGNIVGNAVGSLATGLLALHWLGSSGTARQIGALALLLLLGWLWLGRKGTEGRDRQTMALAAVLALAILVFPSSERFWHKIHGIGTTQAMLAAEDRSGVVVLRLEAGQGPMFIQGHTQSHIPFHAIHYLLGALGPSVHADPAKVLVVGVGSGGTPYAAATHPGTKELRAVELVAPVYDVLRDYATRHPQSAIAALVGDPRISLDVGDGRREIFASGRRYDVIEADAILPQTSHSGLLYSVEFMRKVLEALEPGGLYVQWAPTERVAEGFRHVFPHGILVRPVSILIGSNAPIAFDPEAVMARLRQPHFRSWAARAGIDVEGFARDITGRHVTWGPQTPRSETEVNSDLFPRDEYFMNNEIRGADRVGQM